MWRFRGGILYRLHAAFDVAFPGGILAATAFLGVASSFFRPMASPVQIHTRICSKNIVPGSRCFGLFGLYEMSAAYIPECLLNFRVRLKFLSV
jgi:hypothetical protein